MLENNREEIRIAHPDGTWAATHLAERLAGPESLSIGGQAVLQQCRFYVDDVDDGSGVVEKWRASRKGGVAVVLSEGYFPFGANVRFRQGARYAANHVRVTLDIAWPKGATVRRHFGIGSLILPGRWMRFYSVPPAAHWAEGVQPEWRDIPAPGEQPLMIAHWHRAPLALVFEREDGTAVEIGTGSDVWRWEHGLGQGPEQGSYKVSLEKDGLHLLREPLMCCAEFAPEARDYRFSWYVAWRPPGAAPAWDAPGPVVVDLDSPVPPASGAAALSLVADFAAVEWASTCRRVPSALAYVRGERTPHVCWHSSQVQSAARRLIRRLAAAAPSGHLDLHGVTPGLCWDPAHLDRHSDNGLAHWDINAILEFGEWARQQLGLGWHIRADAGPLACLPSLQGLFGPNGFETEA
ncbi:MAG: hypothetical protein A3K19_04095 [Lentisphaerae bacterium RIFOXYB12_FULL_65_16]|nr:MAG: hypothetical protein A3K18_08290 [Lentisphaerae bacterium RIFOXYA12_64_32]OGV84267.1 MAG: hypothetical protein A3K19_04095 [Lentisphaerae bacterium RIFOXYB12_FULL_65_16]